MAVELRCPDCRAKLRLKAAPEPGTEIECPKCGTVFPAPEPEADEDAPKKKKKPAQDEDESGDDEEKKPKKEKKAKKAKKEAKPGEPKGPKKRKAKKQETSKAALIGVISAAVLMVVVVVGVLIWFFSRTSKSVEMMYYLPEDTNTVVGWNVGHHQKYPEFYKASSAQDTLRTPGETIAKGMGTSFDSLVDYVVLGGSPTSGTAFVFRTKYEFDPDDLSKVPGAEKQTLDGKTYYRMSVDPKLPTFKERVFAPTNRLIVVCSSSASDSAFKKMLNGNADNKENTIGVRAGTLGKRVTRGTFWTFHLFSEATKVLPPPPPKTNAQGQQQQEDQMAKTIYETANGAKGFGFKASLGSREVRIEIDVWYADGDKASSVAKKWKESELGKGDEGDPPRWFKDATSSLGDKRIAAQILTNLGFGSSGEVFYIRTAVETADLKQGSSLIGKVMGQEKKQDNTMPGGPAGAPPPPGAPPGGPPGPPKTRRRWVQR